MRIERRRTEDVVGEARVDEVRGRTGWGFPRRGLLQPGVPDGTWRYVWVTLFKGAIGAICAVAIWPFVPAWEATLGHVAGADRQLARALWMMFVMFVVLALWGAAKAVQGAWLAAR